MQLSGTGRLEACFGRSIQWPRGGQADWNIRFPRLSCNGNKFFDNISIESPISLPPSVKVQRRLQWAITCGTKKINLHQW